MEPVLNQLTIPQAHQVLQELGSGRLQVDLKAKDGLISQLFSKTFKKEKTQELEQTAENLFLAKSTILNELSNSENLLAWQTEIDQAIKEVGKRHFKTPEKVKALEKIQQTLQELQTSLLKEKMKRYTERLSSPTVKPKLANVATREIAKSLSFSEKVLGNRYILKQEDRAALAALLANPLFKEQFDVITEKTVHVRNKNQFMLASGKIPHEKQAWNKDLLAHLASLQTFVIDLIAIGLFHNLNHNHINPLLTEIIETAIPYSDQVLKDTLAIGILGNVFTELLPKEQALQFKEDPQSVKIQEPKDPERMGTDIRAWQSYYSNKNRLAYGEFEDDPQKAHYHVRNLSHILQRTTWRNVEETAEQAFISGMFTIGFRTDDDRLTQEFDIALDLTEIVESKDGKKTVDYETSYEILRFIWRLEKEFAENEQWISDMKFGRVNQSFPPAEGDIKKSYDALKLLLDEKKFESMLRIAASFVYDMKYRFIQAMLALQDHKLK